MPPIHTHECDCTQPKSTVVMRGEQTDCTAGSCRDDAKNATALNARLAAGRANAATTARYEATKFADRGRSASL